MLKIFFLIAITLNVVFLHAEKPENSAENKQNAPKKSYLEKIREQYTSHMPYVMVPKIIIPIIKKENVIGYFVIQAELKATNTENYRLLVANLVFIKDEIFCDLFAAMSRLWLESETPSTYAIEIRIKNRIKNYFKKDLVEKVIFHDFDIKTLPISRQKS